MNQSHTYTNELIHESSPYLLQHAHNPVNWVPWNEKALLRAQQENKLLIISVGYAACHWCHVMERESFEDVSIAKKMNDSFVSIKVDREERPDIDQIYMEAAQLMTGQGGWPLNIIALPDGRPIFAGTYFPQSNWSRILDYFADVQSREPDKVAKQAEHVMQGLRQIEVPNLASAENPYSDETLVKVTQEILKTQDIVHGGRKGAPKFPMPAVQEFLLTSQYFTDNESVTPYIKSTLDNMANGGLFDQLGGGFARYSVDDKWIVPHFEKMLYDNAQLISLYSHAYQRFGSERYAQIIRETISFCLNELLDESNGFYSSLDADSEGEEGKYYVWSEREIESLLSNEEARLFKQYYGTSKWGNFEGSNILVCSADISAVANQNELTISELNDTVEKAKTKLLTERANRVRPGLDDKILTAWNGLMIIGLADAFEATSNAAYRKQALATGRFIADQQMNEDGKVWRNFKNGKSSINGFLDDYAFTILAFLRLYQISFDETWLTHARCALAHADQYFFDVQIGYYFYTSDLDPKLITRKMELSDNVIPASNSAMAEVNYLLSIYDEDFSKKSKAERMVSQSMGSIAQYPNYYSNWARVYMLMGKPMSEVAIVGNNWDELRRKLTKPYMPNKILLGGESEGSLGLLKDKYVTNETLIYVCEGRTCQRPTNDTDHALTQIKK